MLCYSNILLSVNSLIYRIILLGYDDKRYDQKMFVLSRFPTSISSVNVVTLSLKYTQNIIQATIYYCAIYCNPESSHSRSLWSTNTNETHRHDTYPGSCQIGYSVWANRCSDFSSLLATRNLSLNATKSTSVKLYHYKNHTDLMS